VSGRTTQRLWLAERVRLQTYVTRPMFARASFSSICSASTARSGAFPPRNLAVAITGTACGVQVVAASALRPPTSTVLPWTLVWPNDTRFGSPKDTEIFSGSCGNCSCRVPVGPGPWKLRNSPSSQAKGHSLLLLALSRRWIKVRWQRWHAALRLSWVRPLSARQSARWKRGKSYALYTP
jgi:hypothetical protein